MKPSPLQPACPPAERVVEILVDYACAAKCPFCYNPPLTPQVLSKKLALDEVAAALVRRRREGYDGAWLTGGEVTQRPDLEPMLALARRLGYRRIQIGTNGLRAADPAYARRLASAGLNYARVSIHGAEPEFHDRLLGLPGAFDKAVASLAVLREAGVAVGVNFVLNRWNAPDLPAFCAKAAVEWELDEVDVLFPHLRGVMAERAGEVGLAYREAAPWLEQAWDEAEREGRAARFPRLVNFPPCVLPPRVRGRAVDWRLEDARGHRLEHEGGAPELAVMKALQRRRLAACASCSEGAACLGFEEAYAGRYGEAEFEPLLPC